MSRNWVRYSRTGLSAGRRRATRSAHAPPRDRLSALSRSSADRNPVTGEISRIATPSSLGSTRTWRSSSSSRSLRRCHCSRCRSCAGLRCAPRSAAGSAETAPPLLGQAPARDLAQHRLVEQQGPELGALHSNPPTISLLAGLNLSDAPRIPATTALGGWQDRAHRRKERDGVRHRVDG